MSKGWKIFLIVVGIALLLFIISRLLKDSNLFTSLSESKKTGDLRYFRLSEFDSGYKAPEDNGKQTYTKRSKLWLTDSGIQNMDKKFLRMLDDARHIVETEHNKVVPSSQKVVFSVNSGYRTPHYNNTLTGSVPNSAHTKGMAADISLAGYSDDQIKAVLEALVRVGFKRFGLAKNYVHVDNDLTKPSPALWTYSTDSIQIDPFTLSNTVQSRTATATDYKLGILNKEE